MRRKNSNGLVWFEFDQLYGQVTHGVISRCGGKSLAPFDSLNVCLTLGDDSKHVIENREKIKNTLGLSSLIFAKQIHSDRVARIDTPEDDLLTADALVTNLEHVTLCIQHADCQALLLYDPVKKVIANVHAGWRGNVLNIYKKTIAFMGKEYGSSPEDLFACISPSLGPKHSEFINHAKEFPKSFERFCVGNNYFDLWKLAEYQLIDAGIPTDQIEVAKMCTYTNEEDFFSYRRDSLTGRNVTLISLS